MADATTKSADDVKTVHVLVAKDLLNSGHRYLDVRTYEEFNTSHVDNALNVPYLFSTPEGRVKNPDFLSQVSEVCKKDDKLILACNAGGRGLRASVDLLNAGYDDVANMEGGYSAWLDNGLAGHKPGEEVKLACKFRPRS